MAIHGATPTMLKAIDSLQLASVNPGSKQTLALHLGEGKDYTIQIGKGGGCLGCAGSQPFKRGGPHQECSGRFL